MSSSQPRPIHYVLSTHWDREWYLPFQAYRERMVQLLDKVIEGLTSGEMEGAFTMDGQSIPIEDYLEIRSEMRETVHSLIREGKIRLGPWYVMPDEFLVSGESLVRNLRYGRELARQYGGIPSNVGFLCDMFGHTGQMPQIFGGFGIKGGFIWRGANHHRVRHLRWLAPDGTELLCYRRNYCDFSFEVRRANEPYVVLDKEQAHQHLADYIAKESEATELTPILLFDGGDHQYWDRTVYSAVQAYCDAAKGVKHTDLDAYIEAILSDTKHPSTVVQGELREPSSSAPPDDDQWMIPGCLASRVWIKQWNARCEHLLTQWAEPWSLFAGQEKNLDGFIHQAWRWLLQNHPHDSMGGCSIDQVHDDMRYRFSQCEQIAKNVTQTVIVSLAAQSGKPLAEDEVKCVIFNALPIAREGAIVEIDLPIPTNWKIHEEAHNYTLQPNFHLYDDQGSEIAWYRIAMPKKRARPQLRPHKVPQLLEATQLKVLVKVDLPAAGYVTLIARENKGSLQVRHPLTSLIAVNDHSLDNGLLRLEVSPAGGVTLTDLGSGNRFGGLLTMEDAADIGDGWCHAAPFADEIYTSRAISCSIAIIKNTPLAATLKVTVPMQLPRAYDWHEQRRSPESIALSITHYITLKQGARRAEIETVVENNVCDHRLRVLFPSNVPDASEWLADAAFDVVERPIALRDDNHHYRELEVETKPMQTWMAVHNESRGLAVVTEGGLLEGAVRDTPERQLALTLFRSTKRTIFTEGEPGGQLIGEFRFRYAIVPLNGAPERAALAHLATEMAGSTRVVTLMPREEEIHRTPGEAAPNRHSFIEVKGESVLTSFRSVHGTVELRGFNPNHSPATLSVDLKGLSNRVSSTAAKIDLEGVSLAEPFALSEGAVKTLVKPKEVVSYKVDLHS